MSDDEYHVASFVVRARPEHGEDLAHRLNAMPGVEVHVQEEGKLVVTAEAGSVKELADRTAELEHVKRVISVAPVYHEFTGVEASDNPVLQRSSEKSSEKSPEKQ